MLNSCILPGPAAQLEAFTGRDVRARTEGGRPAWWCKFDKVVVFDGVVEGEGEGEEGETKFKTRSSKGLSIARRRGDCETVVIPLGCEHCCEMLNRNEWKYDVRVCARSVCWDCKERCRWESVEAEKKKEKAGEQLGLAVVEGSRVRADSVLQDQGVEDEELMRKVGIETGSRSPIEAVGGIEERLERPVEE